MANWISDEKFDKILNCLADGKGIRETARIVGVSKNTVKPIWKDFYRDEKEACINKMAGQ